MLSSCCPAEWEMESHGQMAEVTGKCVEESGADDAAVELQKRFHLFRALLTNILPECGVLVQCCCTVPSVLPLCWIGTVVVFTPPCGFSIIVFIYLFYFFSFLFFSFLFSFLVFSMSRWYQGTALSFKFSTVIHISSMFYIIFIYFGRFHLLLHMVSFNINLTFIY